MQGVQNWYDVMWEFLWPVPRGIKKKFGFVLALEQIPQNTSSYNGKISV